MPLISELKRGIAIDIGQKRKVGPFLRKIEKSE